MRFLFSLFISTWFLGACSVYRSDGRKFLEKQAYEYAGVEAYRESCHDSAETTGLTLIQTDSRAQVVALDATAQSPSRIRVAALGNHPYSCDYGFTTQQAMMSNIPHAIDQTLDLSTKD